MLSESVFDFFISYRTLHVLLYANTHINLQMGYLMYSVSLDLFAHRILFFFFWGMQFGKSCPHTQGWVDLREQYRGVSPGSLRLEKNEMAVSGKGVKRLSRKTSVPISGCYLLSQQGVPCSWCWRGSWNWHAMTWTSVNRTFGRFCSCSSLAQVSSHAPVSMGNGKSDAHTLCNTSLYVRVWPPSKPETLVPGQSFLYFSQTIGVPPSDSLSRANPIWF